jgi:ribose transport system ATP-binding protein
VSHDDHEADPPGGTPNDTAVVLRLEAVSKAFGPTRALQDVGLTVRHGSIHALLGGNGSGKSTLIKALAGVQPADTGTAMLRSGPLDLRQLGPQTAHAAGLRFVHQNDSTFSTLSVAENLAIGSGFVTGTAWRIAWRQQERRAREAIERFGIKARPSDLLQDLGPATRKMIEIARALQDVDEERPGVLVLDEPTAALPTAEANALLDAIRTYAHQGQSIMYVTHRLEEVFALADEATILRDGRNWTTVRPRDITHDELVTHMMGDAWDSARKARDHEIGAPVLEVEDISAGATRNCSLTVRAGEVVGVAGLIGSGRSSLLKALFGDLRLESGAVTIDSLPVRHGSPREAMRAGIAYVPEDRSADAVFPGLSVRENLSIAALSRYWRRALIQRSAERADGSRLLGEYLIKAPSDSAPIGTLSGGNQQKVVLARWLRRDPRVVLLDEPTQGVDVRARAEIYQLIATAARGGTAVLFVSSDFEELVTVCDSVAILRSGHLVTVVPAATLDAEKLNVLVHAPLAS